MVGLIVGFGATARGVATGRGVTEAVFTCSVAAADGEGDGDAVKAGEGEATGAADAGRTVGVAGAAGMGVP